MEPLCRLLKFTNLRRNMDLHLLLTHLSDRDVKLSANGVSLDVDAPAGVLTPELRDSLVAHKTELLSLLHRQDSANSGDVELPGVVPDPDGRYDPFPLTEMQYAF